MRVSIFGLGYVGCVSAACFAREGFEVLGVDVNQSKVDAINSGRATIVEEGIAQLVEEMVSAGRLRATSDVHSAVEETDVSLVCVGTPSRPNGDIDLGYVQRVCEQIGSTLAGKDDHHTVVIRSTVLPGTMEDLVVPTLEQASGKVAGHDFSVASNPEFLREGTSIRDFFDPPFTLIGCFVPEAGERVRALYAGVGGQVFVTEIRIAEAVKYVCNCFHAAKVSFANEIGNICKAMGIDSHEVMQIVCEDTKLNISPAYLKPGFAFGGSCLPKDLRALTYRAKQLDIDTPVLGSALEANRLQVEKALSMVLASGARRVGILGLAFKAGTDDVRESPIVALVERLIGKGLQVRVYDQFVSESGLIGANRSYLEDEIPHIWSIVGSLDEVLESSEILVVGNAAPELERLPDRVRDGQVVIDLVRMPWRAELEGAYDGMCW